MREEKITCDACGKDLTTTGPQPMFRLMLTSEEVPSDSGGLMHAIRVYPDIDKDHHFCNTTCLADWVEGKDENA